jgi:AraC-like DNA-binding protein
MAHAEAVQLLQRGDTKLFEIAKSVGYESDAAFSKAFKRVLGITPGEHRRNGTKTPQPPGT